LQVRVSPNSRHSELKRAADGGYLLKIAAAAIENRANLAVCRWFARSLRIPAEAVAILHGSKGRRKIVRVEGLEEAEVERRLAACIG